MCVWESGKVVCVSFPHHTSPSLPPQENGVKPEHGLADIGKEQAVAAG